MDGPNTVFDQTLKRYRSEIAGVDFGRAAAGLGVAVQEETALIPLLGRNYRVSAEAITGAGGKAPPAAVCVILCKYLLMRPESAPQGDDWVSFRDFRDAAPLVANFANNVEGAIARKYAGRADELRRAVGALGGRPPSGDFRYDASGVIPALPKIPLLLLFNDADEDFPAACSVLFERRAECYLDMECLAILGMLLVEGLANRGPGR